MAEPRIAPFGSWASPITSDLIVASSIGLGDILVDGSDVYWIESRPQEQGRSVLVRCSQAGDPTDVTPPMPTNGQGAFNVRTRVHEYGGGAYLVGNGIVYFSNDADQRLYRQEPGASPVAITEAPLKPRGVRYADGVMDRARGRMIWVREDHQTGSEQPVNTLVDIPLDRLRPQRTLVAGSDFYAAPRLSPDNTRLAWLEWRHPNMPWDGTELWVGRCVADGAIAEKKKVSRRRRRVDLPAGVVTRRRSLFRLRPQRVVEPLPHSERSAECERRDRAGLPAIGGVRFGAMGLSPVALRLRIRAAADLQLFARRLGVAGGRRLEHAGSDAHRHRVH